VSKRTVSEEAQNEGLPGTVTLPGLIGWRYWRWLPRVVTCSQPSASMSLMIARTFTSARGYVLSQRRARIVSIT